MKTLKVILIIAIVIGVFGVIKFFLLTPKTDVKPAGAAPGGMPASPVNIYVVKFQELNNKVFATGTVIANEEVILMPEISGKITYLNINEGNAVNKGDLLVKINDADFQAQLKKQELQLKLSEEKLGRLKQLLSINGISQEEYDIALNQSNTIKAEMDFTKVQIAKTEVRAPFYGIMGLKYVSIGSTINPSTRIASILQMNQVKIDFSVPEKYAGILSKNDLITFQISDNKKVFQAKIFAIEPKIDQATRTLQLRAIAENSKGELFAGAFAKIELPLNKIDNALMIPTEAIIPILKGKKVFLCKEGKAKEAIVETGIRTDTQIQIVGGLSEGDTVVTTGIMQLNKELH
jgi:membrane fusion protein (multidrug efflux system)